MPPVKYPYETLVSFTEAERDQLFAIRERDGVPVVEQIRRAVRAYLRETAATRKPARRR